MLAFMAIIFTSVFLSENTDKGLRYLDPRLPLLYFPLSIGLIHIDKQFRDRILLGIAAVITIASIVCFCWAANRAISLNNTSWLYNDALTLLTEQQSIYISLLVNISIYIFGYFIFIKSSAQNKGLMVIATLFLFVFSFLLASRNLMVVLYVITIGFAFFYIIRRRKYLEGVTLLMGLVIGVFLVFKFFPKTLNRFKELTYTQYNYESQAKESHYDVEASADQWTGSNFRIAAWSIGWDLFKANPLMGVDLGDKKDVLRDAYKKKNFRFALDTDKNLHNNYLDIMVSMGIVGIIFFLIAWIINPVIVSWRFNDGLAILVIISFAFAMITEVYLDRGLGGMLLGFFIPLLLADKRKQV